LDIARDLDRLLATSPGLTARQLAAAIDGASKKEVNKILYRGERENRYRRSADQRPRWELVDGTAQTCPGPAVDAAGARSVPDELTPYVGKSAAGLNARFDLGVSMRSKHQVRQVAERLLASVDTAQDSSQDETTRVVRIDLARWNAAEDVQLGFVSYEELAACPFARSRLRQQVDRLRLVLFSRERDLANSRFVGVRRWRPTDAELELIALDYEAARRAVRHSDLGAIPRGDDVHVVRYGTKGPLATDTCQLPDGTYAARRAFYLVKRYLRGIVTGPPEPQDRAAQAADLPPESSKNAGLLLELLRERLD
jgi:hypothetical protein